MRVNLIDIYMDENIEDLKPLAELKIYNGYVLEEEGYFTIPELEEKAFKTKEKELEYREQLYLVAHLMRTFGKMWHESLNK